MKRVALILLLLIFAPVAAHAEETDPAPTTTPIATTPAATPAPSSANYGLMPGATTVTSDGLGPSSSSAPAGGSTNDAGALQPAGGSPLQSTTSDNNNLAAPSQPNLQAPATTNDALRVLMDEADGPTRQLAGDNPVSNWNWLWITLVFGVVTTAIYLALRRYPRLLPIGRLANRLADRFGRRP